MAAECAFAEAAEVLAQTMELVPGWAAGWANLGRYREESGDMAGALEAWLKSAELDREGIYGAALKLVAHGAAAEAQGGAYVEALFDGYAARFEQSLVDRLGYRAPHDLMGMIGGVRAERGGTAYDLGCGTGLMGLELRPTVRRLVGVDISGEMIAEAGRKDIYDKLVKADLLAFLDAAEPAEVITATDVLNYTGPLPPVLKAVHDKLAPGGLFAFSLELFEGSAPVKLRGSLRYAHNGVAAKVACAAAGFAAVAERETVLRSDRGEPVMGLLLVIRRV